MIKELNVKNFALIDDITITFDKGLTAITGETGSGKSILLESLALLFAKRSDADMIRYQSKTALVSGIFILSEYQQEKLSLPEHVEILREIDKSGKHSVRLNGELVTLARLKEVSSSIGLIHAQNDTFSLMDKNTYIDFIDQVDVKKISALYVDYLMKRDNYLNALNHYKSLSNKREASVERLDFLSFQVKELEVLQLKKDEKEMIEEALSKLSNYDRIKQSLQQAYESLENQGLSIDFIYDAHKALDKIKQFDDTYEKISEELSNIYYQLDEYKSSVRRILTDFDFDEAQFNQYQERSYELTRIEQKYAKTVSELVDYLAEIKEELEMTTNYDNYIFNALKQVDKNYEAVLKSGLILRKERQRLAKILEEELLTQLKDLDLDKSQFEIKFEDLKEKPDILESGLDQVDFYISLNEGEPLKILSKVASGGEKARFMFALKGIFAKRQNLSLLVLDEIDIGISGKTATKVASKMRELSHQMQLLVITHLPQVAAKADTHFLIEKALIAGRMTTHIQQLNPEKRIEAIAMMLSDDKISSFAIEQAKMLLNKS